MLCIYFSIYYLNLTLNYISQGNASGKNSEHYIFYDLGKCLSDSLDTAPPILMTLISGLDAVISEQLTKGKGKFTFF